MEVPETLAKTWVESSPVSPTLPVNALIVIGTVEDIISSGKKGNLDQVDVDKATVAAEDYVQSLREGKGGGNTARILQGTTTMINNRYIPIQDPFFIINPKGEIELHYSLEQSRLSGSSTNSNLSAGLLDNI